MRRAGWILAGTLAALALLGGTMSRQRHQRELKAWNERSQGMVKDLLSQRKPVPVGRFLLDLPKGAQDLSWTQGYKGAVPSISISAFPLWPKAQEFAEAEAAKWQAEKSVSKVQRGAPLLERFGPSKRVPHTWILFYWEDDLIARMEDALLRSKVFHWQKGRLFEFHWDKTDYAGFEQNTAELDRLTRVVDDFLLKLRVLEKDEIPTGPGFCMRDSFLADLPKAGERVFEVASLGFGIKGHPDIKVNLISQSNGKKVSGPLLERHKEWVAKIDKLSRGSVKDLRVAPSRTVAGLEGQEALARVVDPENGRHLYDFRWEAPGKLQDPYAPLLLLELELDAVKPSLSEEALIQLWDALLGSLRVRPTGAPAAQAPGTK